MEVCMNNVWGDVCDVDWGINQATVVCNQLGFLTTGNGSRATGQFMLKILGIFVCEGVVPIQEALFGPFGGPLFYTSVACDGTEDQILNCSLSTDSTSACTSSDYVGVRCQGELHNIQTCQ